MTVTRTVRESTPKVSTRELRALRLFERHGHRIERLAPDVYLVPSQDSARSYRVLYGEQESCLCPDHKIRGVNCVHIYVVGISLAKRRGESSPCLCYEGLVFVGHLVEDPGTGEEVEAFEPVSCRRCGNR